MQSMDNRDVIHCLSLRKQRVGHAVPNQNPRRRPVWEFFSALRKNKRYPFHRGAFTPKMFPAIFLTLFVVGLSGCSGTYGRLVVNQDVKALFERNEVLPDHQYFYTQSPTWPRVIIALHKDYTLQSDFWHPVEATPEKLKGWMDWQQDYKQLLMGRNGSDILDENGRKIGVWYALKNARDWGKVQMIDHRTVNIIVQEAPENPLILDFMDP